MRKSLMLVLAVCGACSTPTDSDADAAADIVDEQADGGGVADEAPADDTAAPLDPSEVVCRPCEREADCGGGGNLCLSLPDGGDYCGYYCGGNADVCPDDTECLEVVRGRFQCMPRSQRCTGLCEGVVCAEGEQCDPGSGACFRPLGLCEPCRNSDECGGVDDLCLTFSDRDRTSGCGQDCTSVACPDGYLCATVTTPDATYRQCVPEAATCRDYCEGVACSEGERCNPRTGECVPPGGLCEPCVANDDCGGDADLCLALAGGACTRDGECLDAEVCDDAAGRCVGQFCGVDCAADPTRCPEGASCFTLTDGGAQCLPSTLSCVDRCAEVVCPTGYNCDDTTGGCVESTLSACQGPCDNAAACGGPDDRCLAIGVGEAACFFACGAATDRPCPLGYTCALLSNGETYCLPSNPTYECGDCRTARCPDGEVCDPTDGACHPRAVRCLAAGGSCPLGEVCNPFVDRCEPIGGTCTYETRFDDCDFSATTCTAATSGRVGTCEQLCFGASDCPAERPICANDHGTTGGACVATAVGGAHTCGQRSPAVAAIGRPCTVEGDPEDPAICPDATASFCLEAGAPGFCTARCSSDEVCGDGATCEQVGDASFCIPSACACVAGPALGDGERDLLAEALATRGLSRCDLHWSDAQRRAGRGVGDVDPPLALASTAPWLRDPLQAVDASAPALDPLLAAAPLRATDAFVAAAALWGVVAAPSGAFPSYGASPIGEASDRLGVATGGPGLTPGEVALLAELPVEIQQGIAQVLDAAASSFRARVGLAADWGAVPGAPTIEELLRDLLDGPATWPDEVAAFLSSPARRDAVVQMGMPLLEAIDAFPREVGVADVATPIRVDSPLGAIVIAGRADDVHRLDSPVFLLVDLGGDDTYVGAAGATQGLDHPIAIVIDLGGADTYRYDAVPDAADAGFLPSDGAGRAVPERLGDGPTSLSARPRQGFGALGFGGVFDFGDGADTFASLRASQGFGLLGVGVVLDDGGTATFSLEAFGQGAGALGIGLLVLGDAPHRLEAVHAAQGFGDVGGVGLVVGGDGDDVYVAAPGSVDDGSVLYFNAMSPVDRNLSLAQGAASGRAAGAWASWPAAGGVGALVDRGGSDTYVAGVAARGFGRRHGVGLFHDAAGDDTYTLYDHGAGAGVALGLGVFVDAQGSDRHTNPGSGATRSAGYGDDFGAGLFVDRDGNDVYELGAFSGGYGRWNGFGLFVDSAGSDQYRAAANESLGSAVLTILGSEPSTNPRRRAPTFGVFVDAGGLDTYERPTLTPPGIADDATWTQTSPDEAALPTYGLGIDGEGVTGLD